MSDSKSFTSASEFPVKLAADAGLVNAIVDSKYIPLTHLQLIPTNKCPLNCTFCSCKKRDKSLELSADEINDIIVKCGPELRSVTITGVGDPFAHKEIDKIIKLFDNYNIPIGVVTNGVLLKDINRLDTATWVRFSVYNENLDVLRRLLDTAGEAFYCDIGYSFVFSNENTVEDNISIIKALGRMSYSPLVTHIRVVDDILNPTMTDEVIDQIKGLGYPKIIVQPRSKYTEGMRECSISLLKPVIAADGYIYSCCGVQYAQDPPAEDLPASMRMGHWTEINEIWKYQMMFDGSKCVKCYYSQYNNFINSIQINLKHKDFV